MSTITEGNSRNQLEIMLPFIWKTGYVQLPKGKQKIFKMFPRAL